LNILKGNLLTNPLENLPIEEQYTYNFEGNSQALDHILISKNLANMSPEFKVVHINSDFGMQSSDHDPVELRIKFP
jgi:predicted extracellular nuclease